MRLPYPVYLRPKDTRHEVPPRSGFSPWRSRRRIVLRSSSTLVAVIAGLATVSHTSAAPPEAATSVATRIPLRPDMTLDESCAGGDVTKLVDEQDAIGDPASGAGKRPERPYFPGWQAVRYPCHALIDLGATYRIRHVCVFNESGQSNITVSTGIPFAWHDTPVTLTGYRAWNMVPLESTTRYLRVTLTGPTSLSEICAYGERIGGGKLSPPINQKNSASARSRPTMDAFIGANAFIDDPIDALAAPVGFVREYHNWSWDNEGADGKTRFEPSGAGGGNAWRFDDYYAALKTHGITVCPAIQQSSPARFPKHSEDAKPIPDGADAESPASYALHAAHLFQYAARYGSAPVADRLLDLAPGQPRRSGLGLLHYLENWNEPDKTWRGREGRFTPYELAAMCSADRDGDQGRMGKTGVRAADPKMRLVMGGLAGASLPYLRAMKFWADFHRGGDFPADVLNLHIYAGDGDEDQSFKTTGISPEAAHLRERLTAITQWRDANLSDREVWVTEFGYDTNAASPLHAPTIGKWNAEEVQAIWLIRSYLAFAAAGVDRAAMFMFRDTQSEGGGVFATSGMTTQKGQWKPKPSYDYIATLKTRLKGMHFTGEVPSGRKDVTVFRFVGTDGSAAYAVWCPTAVDTHVSNFPLPFGGADTAQRIDFVSGSRNGQASPLTIHNQTMMVEVSEKPLLVLVGSQRRH